MGEANILYEQLKEKKKEYEFEINYILKELENLGQRSSSIVVKEIKGKRYYYEQWRENGSIKYRCLGRLEPGSVADEEQIIIKRNKHIKRYAELLRMNSIIEEQINLLSKEITGVELEDYNFEVFWKDEIVSRVSVKGKRVHVSRYIIHPVRQLFYCNEISRNQLNMILKLRCFDEGRPDALDKLKALGLKEYRPLDIVRKTHGVSYNDFLWFRFPGEKITSKDVLVR